MKSNSISLEGLVPGRDGVALTQPISAVVQAGEILAIQGPNGTGKSTLLKTIAGLLPPIEGSVHFAQDRPTLLYLGHRHGMLPGTSVWANVQCWARLAGAPELAAVAMHYFDLEPYAEADISTLSAGWQHRVSLTRLITTPSPYWLLDEPTTNLDADGLAHVQSLFQSRLEQGGAILMTSTHTLAGPLVRVLQLEPVEVMH